MTNTALRSVLSEQGDHFSGPLFLGGALRWAPPNTDGGGDGDGDGTGDGAGAGEQDVLFLPTRFLEERKEGECARPLRP
jgi:hypothetical protein